MNQDVLTFSLGAYTYDFTDPSILRKIEAKPNDHVLRMGTGYYINDEPIADSFGQQLPPLLSDWIDIALACYLADRLSPRPTRKGPHFEQWSRVLDLKVAVRCPAKWRQPAVHRQLVRLLHFLTDDDWQLEFVKRKAAGRLAEKQGHLFRARFRRPPIIALFSGGLDSFAGAAQQVAELSDQSFVLVSGVTNTRQRFAQREQVKAINRYVGRELCHVTVPFGFNWHGLPKDKIQESSQRTRGFLFLTLASVTALSAGSKEVRIFENGIGAINLPYDASQIGTANSRAVNPITLLRMAEFTEALTGKSLSFTNPFLFKTKGEMCNHAAVRALAANLKTTFSCDGFPVRQRGKPQCGSCTSCLLRRLSVENSGLSKFDPPDRYILDLLAPEAHATSRQLLPLKAMDWQVQKLRGLLKPRIQWRGLVTEFPELQSIVSELSTVGVMGQVELERSILRLYLRYTSEWENFSARQSIRRQKRAA